MFFNSYHQLNKNDFLYKKGEQNGQGFYYLVEGKIELLVKSEGDDEFKFSKSIDKGEFFNEYLTKVILTMKDKRKNFFDIIIDHSLIDLENFFAFNEWDSYRKFKNFKNKNALSALTDDEENFSNQFKNLNDQSRKSIFEQLFEFKLVKEYIVVLFGSLLGGKKYDEIISNWEEYSGQAKSRIEELKNSTELKTL